MLHIFGSKVFSLHTICKSLSSRSATLHFHFSATFQINDTIDLEMRLSKSNRPSRERPKYLYEIRQFLGIFSLLFTDGLMGKKIDRKPKCLHHVKAFHWFSLTAGDWRLFCFSCVFSLFSGK